jgi:hypothetical protein
MSRRTLLGSYTRCICSCKCDRDHRTHFRIGLPQDSQGAVSVVVAVVAVVVVVKRTRTGWSHRCDEWFCRSGTRCKKTRTKTSIARFHSDYREGTRREGERSYRRRSSCICSYPTVWCTVHWRTRRIGCCQNQNCSILHRSRHMTTHHHTGCMCPRGNASDFSHRWHRHGRGSRSLGRIGYIGSSSNRTILPCKNRSCYHCRPRCSSRQTQHQGREPPTARRGGQPHSCQLLCGRRTAAHQQLLHHGPGGW